MIAGSVLNFIREHSDNKSITKIVIVKKNNKTYKVLSSDKKNIAYFNKHIDKKTFEENSYIFSFFNSERYLFIILSEKSKEYILESYRELGALIVNLLKKYRIFNAEIDLLALENDNNSKQYIYSLCLGILLKNYSFIKYLSYKNKLLKHRIEHIMLVGSKKEIILQCIEQAIALSDAVYFARDIVNEPSNIMNAENIVSSFIEKIKSEKYLKCNVFDKDKLKSISLNGILSVNSGSKNKPYMLVVEYNNVYAEKTVLLAGKGVTFDTGGVDLKSSENMREMKCDMSGAAAVLGTMLALNHIKSKINVIAVIPLTDNKTGSEAINPGDIIKMYNGLTVEVENTDAEGRIILADAISYGVKNYDVDYVIDIATLTGACRVTFGEYAACVVGNNKELISSVFNAGVDTYERVWELPNFDEYREEIKSPIADIINTGGSKAGTIKAALFLEHFVDLKPWVHIDIAGKAHTTCEKKYYTTGATGFGVRLLIKTIENISEKKCSS